MKNYIYNLILFIGIIFFIISFNNIFNYSVDNKNTYKQLDTIYKEINIEYEDYLYIDYSNLLDSNNDTVGWILINNTNINYPIVRTNNNSFYLSHSFDKSYNNAGWIFMDYRNDISILNNKNTIIYGHGRLDGSMFGSLRNTLNDDWLSNEDNHIIKLSTLYESSIWEVFSIYNIPTTIDYLDIDNIDIDLIRNRSIYDFGIDVSDNDRILTLSTCYDNSRRIVLHAKLLNYKKTN